MTACRIHVAATMIIFLALPLLTPANAQNTPAQPASPPPGHSQRAAGPVTLGVDALARDAAVLNGKRLGLITNPTGRDRALRATIDVLRAIPGAQLTKLFGPEHGVRGSAYAGEHVGQETDAATGLPVFSLYGPTRKPTAEMLTDLDALVYDMQDIGCRSYTYISTLALAMEAAAEHDLEFIVLDRPNPLGGDRVEGRILDPAFRSFVGQLEIPYVHGLTVGELAQMINGEGWLAEGKKCRLTVVPLEGWRRDMLWADTGLAWTLTSPHIPHAETSPFYVITGVLGELHVLNVGVGYTLPFELLGHPELDGDALATDLNARGLTGVYFRPMVYKPFYGTLEGQVCGGIQIHLLDERAADLGAITWNVLDAVRKQRPGLALFGSKRDNMFDKVSGTDGMRQRFADGKPLDEILAFWREGVEEFKARRRPYLMYE